VRIRHPNRVKRQHFPVTAARFREARLTVGLGVEACADLLRISERTVRNWESGSTRIPFAAYKLLRVLKGGRYLGHPVWRDYRISGDTLVTPEGHRFHAGDLAWWSLLVRRARAFSALRAARDAEAGAGEAARPDATAGATALGLVSSSTSDTRNPGDSWKQGPACHLVEAPPAPCGGSGRQRPVAAAQVAGGAP
jgi:transcriptional regulator with XRE-family HTH domain